ncbi:hypothetical protein [Verrucomicrobium spinosum]|uniref:hypothetical protein n=1 Tax=Verrucomicrobium spinosum TaxID=2736 RepID=UPI0021097753|nr:hypothetical protein [Verrucomicrobium spinosum]
MGQDLAAAYPKAKALIDRADETLGFKLSEAMFQGPSRSLLARPAVSPPCTLMAWRCWKC